MNNRKYEDLEDWEKSFYDLNYKIGNSVWGAILEGDGKLGTRIRVYIEKDDDKEKVLKETGGKLLDNDIVFTVYSQKDHALWVAKNQESINENDEI